MLLSQLQRTKGQLEDSNAGQKLLSSRLEALEEKFEKEKVEKRHLEEEVSSFKNQVSLHSLLRLQRLIAQSVCLKVMLSASCDLWTGHLCWVN